jgi:hypothetical protein
VLEIGVERSRDLRGGQCVRVLHPDGTRMNAQLTLPAASGSAVARAAC